MAESLSAEERRLQRIEDKQDSHEALLTTMNATLARIDERTKKYDGTQARVDDIEDRVVAVEASVNKTKGIGIGGSILVGAVEVGHILMDFVKGK